MLILPSGAFVKASNSEGDIEIIKNELEKNGTSVETELRKNIKYYQNLLALNFLSQYEKDKVNSIINSLDDQIKSYNTNRDYRFKSANNFIYSSAVSPVIAWFNYQGYMLSAELLTHAKENNEIDSLYIPIHGDRVTSSRVFKNIHRSSSFSGKAEFPNIGGTIEKDLYYAIHGFTWTKHDYGKITITDRYDFDNDKSYYSGIQNVAVKTMYEAQRRGVIVPFGIKISKYYRNK
ncbi:hypothetical protein [Helcococcus bovis]|uniref:hypothetical protein n=1 Tax=Helcococcus bovis TaxID=3153252 RepID=UPI0038BCB8D2